MPTDEVSDNRIAGKQRAIELSPRTWMQKRECRCGGVAWGARGGSCSMRDGLKDP